MLTQVRPLAERPGAARNGTLQRPSTEDRTQFERLSRFLEGAISDAGDIAEGRPVRVGLGSPAAAPLSSDVADDNHESLDLPRAAVETLLQLARAMSQGKRLRLVVHESDLTTQAAAELLGVSRPHVIALIERGELDCRMVGTHRRLRSEDVLAYRERSYAQRRSAVQKAQRLSAELEGEY